jgi:hypothetical protein
MTYLGARLRNFRPNTASGEARFPGRSRPNTIRVCEAAYVGSTRRPPAQTCLVCNEQYGTEDRFNRPGWPFNAANKRGLRIQGA